MKKLSGILLTLCLLFLWGNAPRALGESAPEGRFSAAETGDPTARFIQAAVPLNDKFYVYFDNFVVYEWDPATGQCREYCRLPKLPDDVFPYEYPSLPPEQQAIIGDTVSYLATDGQALLGFNRYSGKLCEIREGDYAWRETRLDVSAFMTEEGPRTFSYAVAQNDTLYALVDFSDETPLAPYACGRVVALNMADGSARILPPRQVQAMCLYEAGQLLLLQTTADPLAETPGYTLAVMDGADGKTTPLPLKPPQDAETLAGLAYGDGCIYLAVPLEVLIQEGTEGFRHFSYHESPSLMGIEPGWTLPGSRYALWGSGLKIFSAQTDADQPRLMLQGRFSRHYSYDPLFRQKHPDTLLLWNERTESLADIAEKIRTGDDSVDVYVLSVGPAFARFIEKGYAAALSDSALLAAEAQALYPAVREALLDPQGRLIAYPASFSLDVHLIRADLWRAETGGAPLPQTYAQLFDAMLRYWEAGGGDAVFLNFFTPEYLLSDILAAYLSEQETPDAPPSFQDEALRETLEKLAALEALAAGGARLAGVEETDTPILLRGGNYPFVSSGEEEAYIACAPLGITAAGDFPGSLTVYCVNPHSQNKVLALEYIEIATQSEKSSWLYCSLSPSALTARESSSYRKWLDALAEQQGALEKRLDSLAPDNAETTVLQEEIEALRWQMEHPPMSRWAISPQAATEYADFMARAKIRTASLYLDNDGAPTPSMLALCARYRDGEITLDTLLEELGRVCSMIYRENQ